jgi:hypothetical protein
VQVLIAAAATVVAGDVIVVAAHAEDYDRGVHLVGRILAIKPEPHPEIIQFRVRVMAHQDPTRVGGEHDLGMRAERKVAIFRVLP